MKIGEEIGNYCMLMMPWILSGWGLIPSRVFRKPRHIKKNGAHTLLEDIGCRRDSHG